MMKVKFLLTASALVVGLSLGIQTGQASHKQDDPANGQPKVGSTSTDHGSRSNKRLLSEVEGADKEIEAVKRLRPSDEENVEELSSQTRVSIMGVDPAIRRPDQFLFLSSLPDDVLARIVGFLDGADLKAWCRTSREHYSSVQKGLLPSDNHHVKLTLDSSQKIENYQTALQNSLPLPITDLKFIGSLEEWRSIASSLTIKDLHPDSRNQYASFLRTLFLSFPSVNSLNDAELIRFPNLLNITLVNVHERTLDALSPLTRLQALVLNDGLGLEIENIDALGQLTNLRKLTLMKGKYERVTNLDALSQLIKLQELFLTSFPNVTNLDALSQLIKLQKLSLIRFPNVTNLDALRPLINLKKLDFMNFDRLSANLTNLDALQTLTNLRKLCLGGHFDNITHINALQPLTNLRKLCLGIIRNLTNLDPLRSLTNLQELFLARLGNITNLDALCSLTNLQTLGLGNFNSITNLDALRPLINLKKLVMREFNSLTNLDALRSLTNLQELSLPSRFRDLEIEDEVISFLRGKNVKISFGSR